MKRQNMNNIMIDLETMGIGPKAAIIAIGAVAFDLEQFMIGKTFYEVIDLESSMALGGTVSASTILWWMQQNDSARREFKKPGKHISIVLVEFSKWLTECGGDDFLIWGNGCNFDNVVLRSAYENCQIITPWNFRQDMCFRTIRKILPKAEVESIVETKHNALSDAIWQAKYLITAIKNSK